VFTYLPRRGIVKLSSVAHSLFARYRSPLDRRRRTSSSTARGLRSRPRVEQLEIREVPAVLNLATLGDSLTAAYPTSAPYGANGDHSWTQQLQDLRYGKMHVENLAVPGATSDDVLAQQARPAATLVAEGKVDYVSLIVGANDVFTHLPTIFVSGPGAFIQSYAGDVANNVARTVDIVTSAGDAGMVIGNVPDVAGTPAFQVFVGQTFGSYAPWVLQATSAAIVQANARIQAIATADGIPVVDLYHLSHDAAAGLTVGGHIANPYAPDFFHPNTIAQGIIGNSMLEALHVAYHTPLQPLRLSDQEILAEVGIAAATSHPRSYFDVSPYVVFDHAPVLVR
jgi:lysophospholipase L1-like esterase